ncbi:MAG: PilZ domain-containing protein [Thermodesulfobacteriota bacterium]
MDRDYGNKERRKSPRFDMDWPLEYRVKDAPDTYGGIVVDGSEIGLRIYSVRNMPVGTKLNVVVIFRKDFQLAHFEVVAEVIWKGLCSKENRNGYQYGLEFVQIKEEDLLKLQKLFPTPIRHMGES